MSRPAIAIHGGAGTILRSQMTKLKEKQYTTSLREAILCGWEILSKGGTALDAVVESVRKLEDDPLFNAGKGSVFTSDETHEMDASVMDGRDLNAGAVALVDSVKNPILLARAVMEKTHHVLLCGESAVKLAKEYGLEVMDKEYFFSPQRYDQLLKAREKDKTVLDHSVIGKHGTVGAVAVDVEGNLAAATSTGGMTNKNPGRVGDTAIIGSGTYANNNTCAVSCTGKGEYFIRGVSAFDVSAIMEYSGRSLSEACSEVILVKLESLGGDGGLIAVDADGHIAMPFNSEGMYRAKMNKRMREPLIGIYND
jgi:beta-aspartyl-peptidase (threonine type)